MEEPIQSTEQVLSNCPECDTAVVPGKIFCNKCGFPVNGTNEQKSEYDINKFKLKTQLGIAEKHIKNGSTILYVLAGLTVFGGVLVSFGGFGGGTDGVAPGLLFTVFVVIAAIFVGLGLWAKKKPFAALLTALIFCCTIFILDIVGSDEVADAFRGIILRIIAIVALVRGTKGAYEAEKIRKELNID